MYVVILAASVLVTQGNVIPFGPFDCREDPYAVRDRSGVVWTHRDPAWLREWVARRDIVRTVPVYYVPSYNSYGSYGSSGMGGSCAGGSCGQGGFR